MSVSPILLKLKLSQGQLMYVGLRHRRVWLTSLVRDCQHKLPQAHANAALTHFRSRIKLNG